MVRTIIHIDETRCNGCGLCARACHEGAIDIIDGKAKLVRENFCDGFGDCLPGCPMDAIHFEEREAPAYDEAAVNAARKRKALQDRIRGMAVSGGHFSAPNAKQSAAAAQTSSESLRNPKNTETVKKAENTAAAENSIPPISRLKNWPVQLKLAPVTGKSYDGADLLIASDCTAYACASFHKDFIRDRTTLIGCPKLDDMDYSEKLTEIFSANDIHSVLAVIMEVPCCGGMERAVRKAMETCGRDIPLTVVTISTEGLIL